MARYLTAAVRRWLLGRERTVNCNDPRIAPGDRVLVRLGGKAGPLIRAKVLRIELSGQACEDGIVCRSDKARLYGRGPENVDNGMALYAFLKVLGWHRYQPVTRRGSSGTNSLDAVWMDAFVDRRPVMPEGSGWLHGAQLVLIKAQGAGGGHPKELRYHDGNLEVPSWVRVFGEDGRNPYRVAAEFAEGDLTLNLDLDSDDDDTSLSNIRDAIGANESGRVYLSDGEWL